jgi:hypothetical protein
MSRLLDALHSGKVLLMDGTAVTLAFAELKRRPERRPAVAALTI